MDICQKAAAFTQQLGARQQLAHSLQSRRQTLILIALRSYNNFPRIWLVSWLSWRSLRRNALSEAHRWSWSFRRLVKETLEPNKWELGAYDVRHHERIDYKITNIRETVHKAPSCGMGKRELEKRCPVTEDRTKQSKGHEAYYVPGAPMTFLKIDRVGIMRGGRYSRYIFGSGRPSNACICNTFMESSSL